MRELSGFFRSIDVASLCVPHTVKQADQSLIPERLDSIG